MALVTTIGSKSANSYISVESADSILTASSIYDTAAWTSLASSAKEERLILACLVMNRMSWAGYQVYENQALAFPRRWTADEAIEIPLNIQKTQAFIALDVIHRGLVSLSNPSSGVSKAAIKSLSLFQQSLTVTRADGPVTPADTSGLEQIIRTSHFPIYLLIDPYLTQVDVLPALEGPEMLAEVA